jgi:hypothetical protein
MKMNGGVQIIKDDFQIHKKIYTFVIPDPSGSLAPLPLSSSPKNIYVLWMYHICRLNI